MVTSEKVGTIHYLVDLEEISSRVLKITGSPQIDHSGKLMYYVKRDYITLD